MLQILLVIELIVAVALVFVILIQRSEGGALGIGGGPGGMMSARGAANMLTRVTAVLATIFVGLALVLGVVASNRGEDESIVQQLRPEGEQDTGGLSLDQIVPPGGETGEPASSGAGEGGEITLPDTLGDTDAEEDETAEDPPANSGSGNN